MAVIRRLGRRGQLLLAAVVAACLVSGAPAANAVFTRALSAGTTSVGTYKLASPTGNAVTVTCTPNGNSGKLRLTITVTSHGSVAKANNYVLVVKDSTGLAASPVTLNPGGELHRPKSGQQVDLQYRRPIQGAWDQQHLVQRP